MQSVRFDFLFFGNCAFFFFLCDRSSRDLCCVYHDLFQWLNNSIVIVILTSYLEISKARVTKRKTSKSAA